MLELNLCPRQSVGAIIRDRYTREKLLCLYRKKHPVGLAGIAGHLDYINGNGKLEGPFDALKREIREESGLVVTKFSHWHIHKILPNPCSRGYDGHEWWVTSVTEYTGVAKLMEPDKHEFVKFMTVDEIMEYIFRNDVDPAWLYIWTYLGLAKK